MAQRHHYLIALGSNRRHHRFGPPRTVLGVALKALVQADIKVVATAPIYTTAPVGPSTRSYANSAALVSTLHPPQKLLRQLKATEVLFGRRRGQRWSSRTLDLDIILWDGGAFHAKNLTIPHILFRERDFVLRPANAIAAHWHDPVTGLTVRHLFARLARSDRNTVDRTRIAY